MCMALKSTVASMSPPLIAAIASGIAFTPATAALRPAARNASTTPRAMTSLAARQASKPSFAASHCATASRAFSRT